MTRFDPKTNINHVINWAKQYFADTDATAVIGISGGKDSTMNALFLKKALGPDRVLGVIMPDGEQKDIEDARNVVRKLGIRGLEININRITQEIRDGVSIHARPRGIHEEPNKLSKDAITNIAPRVRMTVLYAVAQSLPEGGRVANTCNWSEDYIGYSTKNGDAAGDFSLLGDYTVSEILEMGDMFVETGELESWMVHKTPQDGLCGKTDEENFGFPYSVLDEYLLTGKCNDKSIKDKIHRMHDRNLHKLLPMPKCHKTNMDVTITLAKN